MNRYTPHTLKHRAVRIFILGFGLLAAACSSTGKMVIPDSESPEARLYSEKCSACHALPHPKRNTMEEWTHLLSLMNRRMQERGIPVLSEQEQRSIMAYLKKNTR